MEKKILNISTRKVNLNFAGVLLLAIFLTAFTTSKMHQQMDELTVKRINIIEDDGTIRMVLSNKARQHSGRMDGVDVPFRERHAGMIFFNDEGDECGGLIYGVSGENGRKSSGMSLTFDQYKNDQVIQILNKEMVEGEKIHSSRGFMINDFPQGSTLMQTMRDMEAAKEIEDKNERRKRMMEIQEQGGPRPLVFLGKSRDGSNGLFLNDENGNPKLMIYVDGNGNPKIQTMDENNELKDLLEK
ncbi:hypothetical protein JKA74_11275 [Marivirga sp. S37H4]|uniref:Uncharacterized protein n=1 Tax=Marivirga aurantiaca TaxID=2802615 RepID=A0A934WZE0_9BACT|nr:hypothetical protein [Marivirga aurantiaca]MBK6265620.1 hypothetical protein [Marivirga aurantiaca]